MKVITIHLGKGGVGKSSIAAVIGVGLAELGYEVAIFDADVQGSQVGIFDLVGPEGAPEHMHQVLRGELDPLAALVQVGAERIPGGEETGYLYVLPGGAQTETAVRDVLDDPQKFGIANTLDLIAKPIRALEGVIDYVVIDIGPSHRTLIGAVMAATDFLIVPTTTDYLSVIRIEPVLVEAAFYRREVNPDLFVVGVVPVMVEHYTGVIARRSNNYRAGRDLLEKNYKDLLLPEIPKRAAWQDANWLGHTILTMPMPDKKAVDEARAFLKRSFDIMEVGRVPVQA